MEAANLLEKKVFQSLEGILYCDEFKGDRNTFSEDVQGRSRFCSELRLNVGAIRPVTRQKTWFQSNNRDLDSNSEVEKHSIRLQCLLTISFKPVTPDRQTDRHG